MHAYSAYKEKETETEGERKRGRENEVALSVSGNWQRRSRGLVGALLLRLLSSSRCVSQVGSRREQTETANGDDDVDEDDGLFEVRTRACSAPVETEEDLNQSQGTRVFARKEKKRARTDVWVARVCLSVCAYIVRALMSRASRFVYACVALCSDTCVGIL